MHRFAPFLLALFVLPASAQIASLHGGDQHWDPQFGEKGLNGAVYATAAAPDGSIYAGGAFTIAGVEVVSNLARWDGAQWHDVGGGVDGYVYALTVDPASHDLYVGGAFQSAASVPANRVARWDGQQWHALGAGVDTPVFALVLHPDTGTLYVGGSFSTAGGTTVRGVAQWDGQEWHALGDGVFGPVSTLLIERGGDLLVGGGFEEASGVPVVNVARWDGQQWNAMGDPGLLEVRALAEQPDGKILAGGFVNNPGDPLVVAWESTQEAWIPILADVYAGEGCWLIVTAIAASEDHLYVGSGDFVCFPEGAPDWANSLLERRGETWAPLGSGVAGLAGSLTLIGHDLYVGGEFWYAGGHPSYYFARWNETLILEEEEGPQSDDNEGIQARVAPNPAHGSSTLLLDLNAPAHLTLRLYSITGRLVQERLLGALPAGRHTLPLPLFGLAAGVYLARLEAEGDRETQRIRLVVTVL